MVTHCGELTPAARLVGAANVLRWDGARGHWLGGNLDGDGFVAGLKQQGHSLAGKRVLLLGAGGEGKAIAYAVGRERPAELVLYNRSMARAEEVLARIAPALPGVAMRAGTADAKGFDVVINATALGLHDGDRTPLPVETLQPGMLVCEAVMRDTSLLAAARERGAQAHAGQYMLAGQLVAIAGFFGLALGARALDQSIQVRNAGNCCVVGVSSYRKNSMASVVPASPVRVAPGPRPHAPTT